MVRFDGPPFAPAESVPMFGPLMVRTEVAASAWLGWADESRRRGSEKLPLQQASAGLLLTGDLNFYNRQSLGEALGISGALLGGLSDSELLLACWQAWGEASLSRLRGDYAFALWDERRRELLLARGPLSAASLFWRELPGEVAFASSRDLLVRLPEVDRKPDLDTAAQFVAGLPFANDRTMFAGIRRLGHGQLARIARGRADAQRFWEPTRRERPMGGRDDAAELEYLLEQAVRARLPDGRGPVASQLSSGRDSGAVTVTAARLLEQAGRPLVALTAAPRQAYAGEPFPGLIEDESGPAAGTASKYANVRHVIVRNEGDPVAGLDAAHALLPNPVGHLASFGWGRDLHLTARAEGADLMLCGAVGNLTISAGGERYLPALWREQGLRSWWKLANRIAQTPGDWPRVLNASFGGMVPQPFHRLIRAAARRPKGYQGAAKFLRPHFRERVVPLLEQELLDQRPTTDPFAWRRNMILGQDPTDYLSQALWQVAVRDPTADQDLVEFCFNLPVDAIVGPNDSRPLYDAAFADRLGWKRGVARPHGHQSADWYLSFTAERVRALFNSCRSNDVVQELLELEYIDELLEDWPSRWDDLETVLLYRNDLLGAVSLAHFLKVNF